MGTAGWFVLAPFEWQRRVLQTERSNVCQWSQRRLVSRVMLKATGPSHR